MKKLLTILLILSCFAVSAQNGKNYPADFSTYGVHYPRGNFDSALHIPVLKDTVSVRDNSKYKDSAEIGIFQGELWYKLPKGYWKKNSGGNGNGGGGDLLNYYSKSQSDSRFQPIGDYLSTADLSAYEQKGHASATYATIVSLNNYLLLSDAAATYQPKGDYLLKSDTTNKWQPKGNYLTSINSSNIITALGFTPYNATNPSAFITATALTPYALKSSVDTAKDNLRALIATKADSIDLIIDNRTVIGAATDADPLRVDTSIIATKASLATKQDAITLTTGGSGQATLINNNLNIPPSTGTAFNGITPTIEATQQTYPYLGYTVNTNRKVGFQFFDNGDGTISIQVAFISANTFKTTEGETLKTTEGETIIYN